MTGDKKHVFKVSDFYNEGPSFPDPEQYPEEEEFEWYRNSKLAPELFERQEPDFAKRYAEWLKDHPLPDGG